MNSESLPGLPGPGDWGGWVNSGRACLRIQFTYWVGGAYGRAPKGPLVEPACASSSRLVLLRAR